MSKLLEQLINELCPEGVEYIRLKECTEMKRGTSATKKLCPKDRFQSFQEEKSLRFIVILLIDMGKLLQ